MEYFIMRKQHIFSILIVLFSFLFLIIIRYFHKMPEPSSKHFERLPKSVIPKNYDLWLKPDLKKLDYEGKVTVQVEVKEIVKSIILNAYGLTINNVEFKDVLAKTQTSEKIELNEADQTCLITFAEPLSLGHGELSMKFHRELDDSMKGFYKSKYTTPDGDERYAAVTQFEPTDARRAFPCWDEPAIKTTFDITLVVQKDRIALSNMNVISDVPYEANNQLREVKFAKTPIMSTYLLAVVVGEFDSNEAVTSDGVLVKIYTPLGKKEQGTFALEVATKSLLYYKDYFDIAYPLPKLDLIAIPDFAAGAMENWGLVTYRETALLVDPQNTAHEAKERIALTVAHEIAHQWFGNLVTMEWWTHLWLNEGFASFMEYLAVDHIFPDYNIWSHFVVNSYNEALSADALSNSHPIEVPVGHPDEVDEIFDDISYNKGCSVIRMLHKYIGDDAFRKGMHSYLTKHAYSNTVTEDLWSALEQASGKPVTAVMSTFTKQLGFPVIQVSSKQDGENQLLVISQEKYTRDGDLEAGKASQWMVPISIITPSIPEEKAQQVLLDNRQTEVLVKASKNDWIKLNPGIVGFYHVQYSEEMIDKLLPATENHSLPLLDRLGLQNDLFALVKAGRKSTVEILKVIEAYTTETNYTVWKSLSSCLLTLSVIISHTEFDSLFHSFCQKSFAKIHAKLGWEPIKGEGHLDNKLRSLVISHLAEAEDKAVLAEALRRFEAHANGTSILPADLRKPVYRAAAKAGDDKTFEKLIKLYHEADLQEERVRISMALGSFRDKTKLSEVLEFALSSDVRSQDAVFVIMAVSANKNGRDLAWNFFKERKDDLRSRYKGGFLITHLVACVTRDFASEEKALEVESFFTKNIFPATERTVLQSLETIRLNSKWLNRDKDAIYNFLSSRQ